MPEIRRLIARFQLSAGLCIDFILSWSLWRRVHQAVAKACHWKRQGTWGKTPGKDLCIVSSRSCISLNLNS